MSVLAPSLTLGIEEEYLLVDLETRELVRDPPKEIMEVCRNELADQVTAEFLRSQIEVGTRICQDVHEAREDLIHLRSVVARTAREYGIAPIAASTHPAADWVQQITTPKDRYDELLRDLAGV
ncbi:MAG: glutamate-cysteine ligase family protein, partial [Alphaproteobacteria bacterium]|nr:glutamate-cysteine ligase family protein [Alphaproteobacteria bacterium]